MDYLLKWFEIYFIHLSAITAFLMLATVYKDGLPKPKKIPQMLKSAIILALIIKLFGG